MMAEELIRGEDGRMDVLTALNYFENSLPPENTTVLAAFVSDNGQFSLWNCGLAPKLMLDVVAALRTVADELESELIGHA